MIKKWIYFGSQTLLVPQGQKFTELEGRGERITAGKSSDNEISSVRLT